MTLRHHNNYQIVVNTLKWLRTVAVDCSRCSHCDFTLFTMFRLCHIAHTANAVHTARTVLIVQAVHIPYILHTTFCIPLFKFTTFMYCSIDIPCHYNVTLSNLNKYHHIPSSHDVSSFSRQAVRIGVHWTWSRALTDMDPKSFLGKARRIFCKVVWTSLWF